jgi:hypothetical protein
MTVLAGHFDAPFPAVDWQPEAMALLDERHLAVWTHAQSRKSQFAASLGQFLGSQHETDVVTLYGRYITDLESFCHQLERAIPVDRLERRLDGTDSVTDALRSRQTLRGRSVARSRYLIWNDADVLLRRRPRPLRRAGRRDAGRLRRGRDTPARTCCSSTVGPSRSIDSSMSSRSRSRAGSLTSAPSNATCVAGLGVPLETVHLRDDEVPLRARPTPRLGRMEPAGRQFDPRAGAEPLETDDPAEPHDVDVFTVSEGARIGGARNHGGPRAPRPRRGPRRLRRGARGPVQGLAPRQMMKIGMIAIAGMALGDPFWALVTGVQTPDVKCATTTRRRAGCPGRAPTSCSTTSARTPIPIS